MRKRLLIPIFVFIMISMTLLNGCKKKDVVEAPQNPPTGNEQGEDQDKDKDQGVMDVFFEIVKEKDPLKIKEYMDGNISKLSQIEGKDMLDQLEKALVANIEDVDLKLQSLDKDQELMALASDKLFFPEDMVNKIKNQDLKREVATLFDTGYKLVNMEGRFYSMVDYKALQDEYNNYVTDEWKEYLAVMAMDSNNPAFMDGSLVISLDDLANRILKTENYLNKYLDSARQEQMLDSYHNKISIYLKGTASSPIADNNKRIKEDVLDSYINTSYQEGYTTAHVLIKYVEAIKENKYIIDERVLSIADDLILEVVETLREYK